jgi:hypothetical protein
MPVRSSLEEICKIPAAKAFNAGQHVYLGTLHHYYTSLSTTPPSRRSPARAGVLGHPGDGKTIGCTVLCIL